jgi:PST family polysaccharide transporter
MTKPSSGGYALAQPAAHELKSKSVNGGVVAVCAQGAKFVLQAMTVILLARLLTPEDFGLVGMVTTLIIFVGLLKDVGLAAATIQQQEITEQQISTLFWINLAAGVALSMLTALLAPAVAAFYGEPRLYLIIVLWGSVFVFSGLAAQHQALIVREMRWITLAKIELLTLGISSALGVVMALLRWHYWALVAMAITSAAVGAASVLLTVRWIPGRPRRNCGIRRMLQFGCTAASNSIFGFLGSNADKILLGRVWGADALGVYGQAYQLATLPVLQLNAALHGVAFSALSRMQDDPDRLARAFLKGYRLIVSVTIPIIIVYLLFAQEVVLFVLGAKWIEAGPILTLLSPTVLVFALANPVSLLVMSIGRVKRALCMTLTTAPLVVLGVILGLSYGPKGVALGQSCALMLLIAPIFAWSKRDTRITWADLWAATRPSVFSGLLSGAAGLILKIWLGGVLGPIPYLAIGLGVVIGVYGWALLILMGEKLLYLDLLMQVFPKSRSLGYGHATGHSGPAAM